MIVFFFIKRLGKLEKVTNSICLIFDPILIKGSRKMLKACIALATAFVSFTVAPVALSQSALTNQDIQYLASLHRLLLTDKDYDFSAAIEGMSIEGKIETGKKICTLLESGDNFKQLGMKLYSREIKQTLRDSDNLDEAQIDAFRSYVLTAWYAGINAYCPEYSYQLDAN